MEEEGSGNGWWWWVVTGRGGRLVKVVVFDKGEIVFKILKITK